jgi:hypothetical protein
MLGASAIADANELAVTPARTVMRVIFMLTMKGRALD